MERPSETRESFLLYKLKKKNLSTFSKAVKPSVIWFHLNSDVQIRTGLLKEGVPMLFIFCFITLMDT